MLLNPTTPSKQENTLIKALEAIYILSKTGRPLKI